MNFDELALLTALNAPVGFEEPVLEYMAAELQITCDSVEIDVRGNLYARQQSDASKPLVMLMAHADEIGFLITSILPGGFLAFTRVGFPTDMVLAGQRVQVLTSKGTLQGTIGVKPGHILRGNEARIVPPVDALYIDVGAASAEEAATWGIEPGTPVTFYGPLTQTAHPDRVMGKAIDDRIGCLSLLEIARRMRADESQQFNVVYVVTVEEEVGLRGAELAARHVNPDVVIAIDTVPAGGTPDLGPHELPWTIGAGPLLKVRETNGLSTHGPLRTLLREVAAAHNIPYQIIVDTAGITDGSAAQQASGNIAAAVLGLPRRYSHSAVEVLDLKDARRLVDWVCALLPELKSHEQLLRIKLPS